MPVPKYVPKNKRKRWIKDHKKIIKSLEGKVINPCAVATAKLKKKYKK